MKNTGLIVQSVGFLLILLGVCQFMYQTSEKLDKIESNTRPKLRLINIPTDSLSNEKLLDIMHEFNFKQINEL